MIGKRVAAAVVRQQDMSLTGVSDVVTDRRARMVSRNGSSPFGATEAHAGAMRTAGLDVAGTMTPALLTADVAVAIGAGTDVAVEAGDVVLVRSDPRDVPRIIALSRASYRKMMQNLWWAAGYNIVAIPLAAGVLARRRHSPVRRLSPRS